MLRLVSSIALASAACSQGITARAPSLPSPTRGVATYDGSVAVDPAARSLRASWRISFTRTAATTDSVTFLLNPSLVVSTLKGADVRSFAERKEGDTKTLVVHLAPAKSSDSVSTIDIAYAGTPEFGNDTINGISENWIELGLDSFWHPVFADFAHNIVARARIDLPTGWNRAASGSFTSDDLVNSVPLIDIAFVASPALHHDDAGQVSVYHVDDNAAQTAKVLSVTTSCAKYLNEQYGKDRPLPAVKMIVAPRGGPGYARKNFIVINRVVDTTTIPLTRFVCHELAHFWSSGAISNGPENWLNEGFAEFVSARYVRATSGEEAYQSILSQWQARAKGQPAIWTPEGKRRPMPGTSYGKAPYLLHRLEQRVGSARMDRILFRYMNESIKTTPALIDMITQTAGAETGAWFRAELSA